MFVDAISWALNRISFVGNELGKSYGIVSCAMILYSSIGILFIQGLEYCLFKDWNIVYWIWYFIQGLDLISYCLLKTPVHLWIYKGWNDLGRSDRMIRWTGSLIHLYITISWWKKQHISDIISTLYSCINMPKDWVHI